MKIFVNSLAFPGYKTFTIEIDSLSRVREVKEIIFKERSIPIELQRLTFRGTVLQNEKILAQYHIEKFNTLNMFLRFNDEIQINVKCPNGSTITIETLNSVKIRSLISSIFMHDNNHRNLGPSGVSIYMDGKRLSDGVEVSKYLIKDGSTLYLDYPCDFSYSLPYDNSSIDFTIECSEIYIKFMRSKTITLTYKINLTVMDIKLEIEEKENIPPFLQCLSFNGIRLESDSSPLITYAIRPGSVLLLELQAKTIFIQFEVWIEETKTGEILWMEVGLNDKIQDLKTRIKELKGFAPEKQRVLFKGTLLKSEGIFIDYHIQTRDSLELHLIRDGEIPVFIRTTMGIVYPFQLNLSDTVLELKTKLIYLEDISIKRQCLYFNDKPMENWRKLSEFDIREGSTLLMFYRMLM